MPSATCTWPSHDKIIPKSIPCWLWSWSLFCYLCTHVIGVWSGFITDRTKFALVFKWSEHLSSTFLREGPLFSRAACAHEQKAIDQEPMIDVLIARDKSINCVRDGTERGFLCHCLLLTAEILLQKIKSFLFKQCLFIHFTCSCLCNTVKILTPSKITCFPFKHKI